MSGQIYQQRFQGNGVALTVLVAENGAQFILARDAADGALDGLAINFEREHFEFFRVWLETAASNTAPKAVGGLSGEEDAVKLD